MDRFMLRDDQWDRLKDHLPGKPGDRGRSADNRLFLEAVLWIARTGRIGAYEKAHPVWLPVA